MERGARKSPDGHVLKRHHADAEEWVRPAAWAEKKGHAQIAELRKWQKSP